MLMKTLEFLGIITVPITLNPQVRLQELMEKKKKLTRDARATKEKEW